MAGQRIKIPLESHYILLTAKHHFDPKQLETLRLACEAIVDELAEMRPKRTEDYHINWLCCEVIKSTRDQLQVPIVKRRKTDTCQNEGPISDCLRVIFEIVGLPSIDSMYDRIVLALKLLEKEETKDGLTKRPLLSKQ